MNLKSRKKIIKKEFLSFDKWEDKYEYLIDLGNTSNITIKGLKSDENLVYGCQSNVWLKAKLINNKIFLYSDSDALIPKGIAALFVRLYSGLPPKEIINSNNNFLEEIGLINFLSPTRANGSFFFLKKIRSYALNFNSKIPIL